MYFTISETPRMQSLSVGLKWTQVLRAHQPRHPRQRYVAAANRRYVDTDTFGSQSVHTCAATRTPHAWIHGPSTAAHRAYIELRHGYPSNLHGSQQRADGGLRSVANSVSIGGAGQRAQAWACKRAVTPAPSPSLSPCGKGLRARLRGRHPSTGWAGPRAIEHTPSRIRRVQGAMPTMKVARPSRAR